MFLSMPAAARAQQQAALPDAPSVVSSLVQGTPSQTAKPAGTPPSTESQGASGGGEAAASAQTDGQNSPNGSQNGASVRGIVADPDAAVIPGATVTLTPASGKAQTAVSGPDGSYAFRGVPTGTYSLTVTMNGFGTFVRQGLRVAGAPVTINAKLAIADQKTEVDVVANPNAVSVDPDNNASTIVLSGKDLDALSDDPDELSSELTALAGPSAGPNGGQIYIDGFTGGQLPPKSSIREIRINQNPFSAQYDKVGYGRIDIFTKPGTDKFHGFFNLQGNDAVLNTNTPFLNGATQPNYYTIFGFGSYSGPLSKWASFTLNGSRRSIQTNSLINPTGFYSNSPTSTTLCNPGDLTCTNYGSFPNFGRAIPAPTIRQDIGPRIDLALGQKNTLTVRYSYENASQINQGLGATTLASAANNTGSTENTVQISDTQVLSDKIVNETRFEYQRDTSYSNPVTTGPELLAQGYFIAGGSNASTQKTSGSHIEFQNYTSVALAHNFIRFGGRLRTTSELLTSNAGANGTFIYNFLLDPCYAGNGAGTPPAGCITTSTPCSPLNLNANTNPNGGATYFSSYQCNLASQFNITKINNQNINGRETDVGLYAEDDWKPRGNLTISYGLRLEAQNNINSAHDFAPRLSINYGVPRKGNKPPVTVLRGGFGIFYDRFALSDTLTAERLNGLNEIQQTFDFPGAACNPSNIAACTTAAVSTSNKSNIYTEAANLRSSYNMQTGVGVDQGLGRLGTLSINYINTRGVHQFFSRAFTLPTSYDDEFDSGGVYRQNQVFINGRINKGRYSLFGYYALGFADGNTDGADSFLSSVNATRIDYGRSIFNRRNTGFVQGNVTTPGKFTISPFIFTTGGLPYNITTGQDNNGDGQYTDRPSFAAGQSSANCSVASTFAASSASQTATGAIIPINYCTGPDQFSFNLRITRAFGFGPKTDQTAAGPGGGGPGGGPPGGGGRGGGGRGGGGFGGGGGGRGGPATASTGRKYTLSFGAQAFNLFNFIPYAPPVSQLTSSRFGQFDSLAGGQGSSGTAVRRFFLQTSLSF